MSLIPLYCDNVHLQELDKKYYQPVSNLKPFVRAAVLDMVKLSFQAGAEYERRRNERKIYKKTKKGNIEDLEDDDDD